MDIMNTFDTNLKKYAGAVESLTKNRKTAKFANESRLRINDFRSERTYVESCCTVLGLPCLFKEDIKHIIMTDVEYQTSEEPARVAICYEKDILGIGKDKFKFAVEGVIVFKCSNFLKAIVGMMMANYTFNLAYPKELHKTLLLLQKVFLCLDDECS